MKILRYKNTHYQIAIRLGVIVFSFLIPSGVFAIEMNTYGKLGVLGSLDFGTARSSYTGVLAYAGADFKHDNGFRWGIGAIGSFTPWEQRSGVSNALNTGDAAEAYIGFQGDSLIVLAGRFCNEFMKFEWLQGNVQGVSLRFKRFNKYESNAAYWLTYANSYLYNGKQQSALGDKIATDLMGLVSYNDNGLQKNNVFGSGEMVVFGVDFRRRNSLLQPYALFHSNVSGSLLAQGGLQIKIGDIEGKSSHSLASLYAIYQYWDKPASNANTVLMWWDQSIALEGSFWFGFGIAGVVGDEHSYFYSLSDASKFYGRSFAPSNFAPYFAGKSMYGYIYEGLDFGSVRADILASFGTYNEYSIMVSMIVWQKEAMKFEFGLGYAYIKTRPYWSLDSGIGTGNALKAFVKFFY